MTRPIGKHIPRKGPAYERVEFKDSEGHKHDMAVEHDHDKLRLQWMILTRAQVQQLIARLNIWLEKGTLK